MLTRVRSFFAAPVFEDEEKTRVASMLNTILLGILAIAVIASIIARFLDPDPRPTWGLTGVLTVFALVMRFFVQRGYVRPIGMIMSTMLWAMVTYIAVTYGGVRGPGPMLFIVVVIIAGLLVGGRVGGAFAALSTLTVVAIGVAEASGTLKPDLKLVDLNSMGSTEIAGVILAGVLLYLATRSLNDALKRARKNERAQAEANRELQELHASLERQITERTADLERRSTYMEASAAVSHAASAILEPEQLIRQVVDLIRERFGLYHAGVFLLDETGQWAEYRAGTGEAGRLLREQGLRLEVGGQSMVGWCLANAQARVAQDVRTETTRVEHPLLAATQSEVALPLIARGQVIGALNAQSDQLGAFDLDTVAVLQTMCDQVAVALDNARLFVESQTALEAERHAFGELGRQAWVEMLRAGLAPGYRYANKRVVPLGDVWQPQMQAALREERQVVESASGEGQAGAVIAAPIKVRGQTIGVIDVRKDERGSEWTQEEIALLETLTDQLGLALDSARLYEESQRLAAREQVINTSTATIRGAATVDAILRRTVEELGRAFNASRASVRLEISEPK